MEDEIRAYLDRKQYAAAFDLVVGQYQNKVFRLAYSMLGNRALAEEAAQDIFLRIWRALPGFRGLSSLSTWIYAVARNACLSAFQSSAARQALSLDEPAVRIAAEARQAAAPAAAHAPDLGEWIARLPDKHRQVIVLFLDYDELAAGERAAVDAHMAECGACRAYLAVLADLDAGLTQVYAGAHVSPAFRRSVAGALPRKPSFVPELLDFLGWAAVIAVIVGALLFLAPRQALLAPALIAAAAIATSAAAWICLRSMAELDR